MHRSPNLFNFSLPALLLISTTALSINATENNDWHWLSGCWQTAAVGAQQKQNWISEMWTLPIDGQLYGIGLTVRNGTVVSHEYTRIEPRKDGSVFIASPNGAAATEFNMIEQSKDRAVFANPAHDFPQRVLYWRAGSELHARIEGVENGQTHAQNFVYQAASCAP